MWHMPLILGIRISFGSRSRAAAGNRRSEATRKRSGKSPAVSDDDDDDCMTVAICWMTHKCVMKKVGISYAYARA